MDGQEGGQEATIPSPTSQLGGTLTGSMAVEGSMAV